MTAAAVRTTLCVCCGAVLTSGGYICRDDADTLMIEVRNASDLLRELDTTLSRMDKVAAASVGGKSASVPLPYSVAASIAATELRAAIRAMSRGRVTTTEVRRFRDARRQALDTIDIPDPRTFIGVCGCGQPVYARRTETEVACKGCGEVLAATQLDSWQELRVLAGPVSKLREWLLMLGVVRSRAQLYRDVARMTPVDGGNVYRLSEVLDRVVEVKSRQRGA